MDKQQQIAPDGPFTPIRWHWHDGIDGRYWMLGIVWERGVSWI